MIAVVALLLKTLRVFFNDSGDHSGYPRGLCRISVHITGAESSLPHLHCEISISDPDSIWANVSETIVVWFLLSLQTFKTGVRYCQISNFNTKVE
jgi:hypothetical protein